jgi:hypothetical protein
MSYRLPHLFFFCLALLLLSASSAFANEDAPPAWLQQAAATSAPTYNKDVPAVVLLNERTVTIGQDGRTTTVTTYAVRILTHEGREEAIAHEVYQTDTGKVREMRAWLIRPGGAAVKRYGKDETVDVTAAPNDVYNEARVRLINASDDADTGAVFGYQVTSEENSIYSQLDWEFQDRLPTLVSRFTLVLPAGWRATGITFNHEKIEPVVNGSTYSWEMHDLAPLESEPLSLPITNLAPRVAISYYPPDNTPTTAGIRTFSNWNDVSRWMSELEDSQAAPDDALASKAQQLTEKAKTEYERIQAIGRYVQGIQYIAIQTGLGRGGGYRPHPATEVFAKSYGDCKDKANLMRAMLRVLKIQSYLVSIYSGDPNFVREEWASPHQFNHCIIAIKVGDETQAPTVVKHPTLGRLLIFDPTDDNTSVGDLPEYEQGSLALIDAKENDALLRMPVTMPEANRLEREAEVMLASDGAITANLRERSIGQSARQERRAFRALSKSDYTKMIESWITRGASGAHVTKVDPTDSTSDGRFSLDVDFTAANYAQLMQNRLLVFKPAIIQRLEALSLTEPLRKHPVVLTSHAYNETVRVKLPEGFDVDELPDALSMDTDFGNYAATYDVKDGQLVFTRKLTLRAMIIPAAKYAGVRSFFERIRAAEQSPVVLARK